MSAPIQIEVMRPAAFGPVELAAWQRFRAASPRAGSPYFDLRYILAASEAAPDSEVAVIYRRHAIVGFLPFQQRGRALHPLGAPMTDFHGLLSAPGETIDLKAVVALLGAGSYRFTGLTAGEPRGARGLTPYRIMSADLSGGYEHWLRDRQARLPRFFKGRRRNERALERDLGPLEFEWSRDPGELLDYVVALKRAQYHRTRQHDIFACGWTERMLGALHDMRAHDFGLGFASLRAGGRLVSAEIGLLSGDVYHLWLPVYDPAYGRYGPGMLMTLRTLEALAANGVRRVDFGRNDADYKAYFADPAETVFEGLIASGPAPLSVLADKALAAGPLGPLADLRDRARRRFDIITACKTSRWAWACGAALAVGLMAQGVAPPARTSLAQPRRPDAQRAYSRLVGSPEERLRSEADDLRTPVD